MGLITYSRYINVYELANIDSYKSVIVDGKENYDVARFRILLDIPTNVQAKSTEPQKPLNENINRYLGTSEKHKDHICEILDNLEVDPWIVKQGCRPERAFNVAFCAAVSMIECLPNMGARILGLIGGPPTMGSAAVATIEKLNPIRAQIDLTKGEMLAEMFKKAKDFYDEITIRLIAAKITVDIFGFSLDQFGMAEMRGICEKTGGFCIIQEQFKQQVFHDSIRKYFECDEEGLLRLTSGGSIE